MCSEFAGRDSLDTKPVPHYYFQGQKGPIFLVFFFKVRMELLQDSANEL